MNYLIDGHNLIGKIDDIKLSDPDDEAKLVLRLVNWAAVGKNRRVIVVFDGGMPGMQWANVRTEQVRPVFVPKGDNADRWLITFMKKKVKNPKEFTLVTSDRAIIKQAENRRIGYRLSEDFSAEIAQERARFSEIGQERVPEAPRPLLKEHEVDAWLQFFGGEPELELKPYQPRGTKTEPTPEEKAAAETPVSTDPADFALSPDEVSEWLDLFGGERTIMTVHEPSNRAKASPGKHTGETQILKPKKDSPKVSADQPMTQEDVDLWHALFGGDE